MFTACQNKGFQMTFDNGWTVSVQFGPGNYCDNYNLREYDAPRKTELWTAQQAEIAARNSRNQWLPFGYDTVDGYKSANEVLEFINKVAALPEDYEPEKPRSWTDDETNSEVR